MNMMSKVDSDDASVEGAPRRTVTERYRALPKWGRLSILAGPLALVAVGGVALANSEGSAAPPAPPPPVVTVATPLQRDVNEWNDYIGRFEASQTVEVRPRVSGQITGVHFRDGDIVQRGQLLFTIDQRPFAAALAEAQAGLTSARSDLSLAQLNYDRGQRLLTAEAISRADVDSLRARVQATTAALAAAQARVRQRSLDMEFTRVRAPIAGRISDRRIDVGNLVAAGEGQGGSLLTTINALDPIYFSFDASEALFLQNRRNGGAASEVEVRLQDETDYNHHGQLDFTDNGLDPRSGTIRGRAVLRNPGLFLTPGMFGNMRLASGATVRALMVPDAAVTTDQARKIVTVVGADGRTAAREVTLGPLVGGLRIIRSGLRADDRVIIGGSMVPPGTPVNARNGQIQPQQAAQAPATATQPNAGAATFATGR